MATVADLYRQGVRCVKRPEWPAQTWLELLPDPGDPTRPDVMATLHQREKTRKERLHFVGGGKSWEAVA